MKNIITLIFIGYLLSANTQILEHASGTLFEEDPAFNSEFIKVNKIKSITGHYATKADLDRIRENANIYVYEFNESGQLIKDYKTLLKDTIVRMYEYDDRNNVTLIRKTDRIGYHSYHYEYDSLNRITKKEYRRDLNKTYNRVNFDLDRTYVISSQTYTYENTAAGLKKNYHNSIGKVYKTELFYEDRHGYLVKQEAHSITGSGTSKVEYAYNTKGLLKERKTTSFLTNNTTTKVKFEYDEHDNVLAQHYYRNGVYKTEYQIVYDSRTLLLSALLSREIETNIITILKFSGYEYFE